MVFFLSLLLSFVHPLDASPGTALNATTQPAAGIHRIAPGKVHSLDASPGTSLS